MATTVDLTSPIAESLERVLDVFDEELRSDTSFVNRLTRQVRRYRGKLLRPKLLLMAGRAVGELRREHIVLGAVVEMVHMATLVHDDVLDDAGLRRRHATVNRMIGNEGAVLLGDYLISHAYHLCSSLGSTDTSRRIAAVTNTVCEGELMQIENRGNFELSEAEYFEIIRRKTASLTSLCCELGGQAADAETDVVHHLRAYGLNIGIAFQIVDDVLDITATELETGKTVGRDADLGKLTLPLIWFLNHAPPRERDRLAEVLSNGDPRKAERVCDVIAGSECLDYAMDIARNYMRSAIAHLDALPSSDPRTHLVAAAEFVVQRRQ